MGRDVDRDQAHAWMARWKDVERHTLAAARALTPEERFRQLESLMTSASLFDRHGAGDEEEERRVRELWMRLRAQGRC